MGMVCRGHTCDICVTMETPLPHTESLPSFRLSFPQTLFTSRHAWKMMTSSEHPRLGCSWWGEDWVDLLRAKELDISSHPEPIPVTCVCSRSLVGEVFIRRLRLLRLSSLDTYLFGVKHFPYGSTSGGI